MTQKITGKEAAIAAEVYKTIACCKTKRQLEIKTKYQTELAELDADLSQL